MKRFLVGLTIVVAGLLIPRIGLALDVGVRYTIELDAVGSDGTIINFGYSTTARADSEGKISFTFSNLPTRADGYNFFVLTIKNPDGTVARRSIAPVAAAGGTTKLGVSVVTEAQTGMFLAALAEAGSDDPILVSMGLTIVRSANMTSAELNKIATAGVAAANGFANELTTLGVTGAQLAAFKGAIVDRLGQFSALYKDSVEAATDAAAAQERGKAAGLLMKILVESATEAGFPEDYIELAMQAAGEVFHPEGMRPEVLQAIDSQMGGGVMRIKAEKCLKKYSKGLITLGATGSQIVKFTTAANNLFTAMQNASQAFEELFTDPTDTPTAEQVTAAQTTMNSAMQRAFETFIDAIAATDDEITDLIDNLCTAFNILPADRPPAEMFTFRKSGGGNPVNWPITMVIPSNWVCKVKKAGGVLTYTRDDLTVPAMMNWLDSDDNPGNDINNTRHDFGVADDNDVLGDERNMPESMASFFGLREDLQIIEFQKWTEFGELGEGPPTMAEMKQIMGNFKTKLKGRIDVIGGTTDGITEISPAEKRALVATALSPEF